jgi:CheY-like chemotaxis protein
MAPVREPREAATILLVEDDSMVRELALRVLVERGYNVLEAGSGEEALHVASEHAGVIDLVVTDIVMPGIDGCEMARRLVEARPGTGVLFVSGYANEHITRQGLLDRGAAFLEKPYTLHALAYRVRQLLDPAR